jgi:hypothetical protein
LKTDPPGWLAELSGVPLRLIAFER